MMELEIMWLEIHLPVENSQNADKMSSASDKCQNMGVLFVIFCQFLEYSEELIFILNGIQME